MVTSPGGWVRPVWVVLCLASLLAAARPAAAQPADALIDTLLEIARERKKREPKPEGDATHKLLVERYNVALDELTERCADFKKNLASQATVFQSARDLLTADLELQEKPEDKARVLEKSVELLKWYEAQEEKALKAGVGLRADLLRTRYVRLTMEIELAKLRKQAGLEKE